MKIISLFVELLINILDGIYIKYKILSNFKFKKEPQALKICKAALEVEAKGRAEMNDIKPVYCKNLNLFECINSERQESQAGGGSRRVPPGKFGHWINFGANYRTIWKK